MVARAAVRSRRSLTISREGDPMLTLSTAAPAVSAAFFASIVEAVEAFTIVLAVATLRGWRPATLGTAAALASLAGGILVLGPLLERFPIHFLQLIIGIL